MKAPIPSNAEDRLTKVVDAEHLHMQGKVSSSYSMRRQDGPKIPGLLLPSLQNFFPYENCREQTELKCSGDSVQIWSSEILPQRINCG